MQLSTLYDLFGLNQPLFLLINGLRSPWLDAVMVLGTHLGDFRHLPWLIGVALWLLALPPLAPGATGLAWRPRREMLVQWLTSLLASCAVTALVVTTLKLGLHLPRPAVALPAGAVHVLVTPESALSFPSGHAAFAMLVALVFWPYCRMGLRVLLLVFALWVGVSRISVGAHFPSDVAAGYACAAVSTWLATHMLAFRARRRIGLI
ncbi:phosphatase PAP2 family protein [Rhodoferax sp.]|uniref:phosphatase PAP2 family protein n=1 Tax=Rhodoferax sp. TaxID=50421 RepID=UPI002627E7B6|nr:phosphatase PAP2 family protein [Rhodoferax sp.]MDD2924479.1 phosphatase PAP2 family protein [Rhodoferax sp.]